MVEHNAKCERVQAVRNFKFSHSLEQDFFFHQNHMQVQSISIFLVVFIPFFLSYNVFSSNEALLLTLYTTASLSRIMTQSKQ